MKTFITPLSADAAVEALKSGIDAANMRLVSHINGQANALKIGKQVPADQILEIFRPDFAIRVWTACKPAGLDIPLRIHIYEDGEATKVACRLPSEVFAPYGCDDLMAVAAELDAIFEAILSSVAQGD